MLDAFAGLAAACELSLPALRLAGAAEGVYISMGIDPSQVYRFELERWLAPVRRTLGAVKVAEALGGGRALTLSEAISEARALEVSPRETSATAHALSPLTPREREVAGLITRGATDREIAGRLVISEHTAHTHVRNILSKLKLQSRVQIAAWVTREDQSLMQTASSLPGNT